MRVRHLQTYLSEHKLLRSARLDVLKDMRIGVDAVYWMRTLQGLKDPLADAIGGLPPSVFGVLDQQVELFKKWEIAAVFVFQGMQPRSHMLFSSQLHQQMDEAWHNFAKGDSQAAQNKFAQATSRINSDFVQFIFHYLKSKECECFQAPYFATAQLAFFVDQNFFDAVFGPPALLLFGVPRVIVNIDFVNKKFEWVEQQQLLSSWHVEKEQFVDACLLAGTEYCLTFPYLNLTQFHHGQQQFTFGTAIEFIKQAPLISYMQHFPNEEMKNDHVDGYCVCKSLIHYPLVMQMNGSVGPLIQHPLPSPLQQQQSLAIPKDYYKIVGSRLPNSIYFLMAEGILSRKLPSVLALGEWLDYSHPTVDSVEYRDLLTDIREYRCRALGLVAMRMHSKFQTKPIKFSRYRCSFGGQNEASEVDTMPPNTVEGVSWKFGVNEVNAEMKRQGCTRVNLKFCLKWHAYSEEHDTPLFEPKGFSDNPPPYIENQDGNSIIALVHFMLLENLGYFTDEGGVTVFGSALAEAPAVFQEDMLFVFELMKLGVLSGEPLEAPRDRPHPEDIKLLKNPDTPPNVQRNILLLTRVMSLCPMQLKPMAMWNAEVDFDLAAFHSIVKSLKRSLRQLTEACLTTLLLKDVAKVRCLPPDNFNPLDPKMPCFFLPRNCMGIVCKYFLEYPFGAYDPPMNSPPEKDSSISAASSSSGNHRKNSRVVKGGVASAEGEEERGTTTTTTGAASEWEEGEGGGGGGCGKLEKSLRRHFSCCVDPMGDLCRSIRFWNEVIKIITLMDESIDVEDLKNDLMEANELLVRKIHAVRLHEHPKFGEGVD